MYVDGFNLYYGALKGSPHKWLNLDELFRRVLPQENVTQIRYFTPPSQPAQSRTQPGCALRQGNPARSPGSEPVPGDAH